MIADALRISVGFLVNEWQPRCIVIAMRAAAQSLGNCAATRDRFASLAMTNFDNELPQLFHCGACFRD